MTDKPLTWHLLEITARSEAEEAIEFALNELDALGTEINTLGQRSADDINVKGYFNHRPGDETLAEALATALRVYGLPGSCVMGFAWSDVEDQDWLAEWKKYWRATTVGPFIIAPPWERVADSDKIVIRIEPNMAFGTGTHETTQLCLGAIGELYRSGESFLDVGTGTGILAIGAARMQGKKLKAKGKKLACDTDANSVTIAMENARLNGVADEIEFFAGSIDDETPVFDLVCANLTIDVIVPILPLLIAKTRSTLLLSGILAEQQDQIERELARSQVSDVVIEKAGEWISVTVRP